MTPRSAASIQAAEYAKAWLVHAWERLAEKLKADLESTDDDEVTAFEIAFSDGYLTGHLHGHAAGLADTAELHQELANISGWLKRMSALKWDDETYAPNFKATHERAEQALARFKALAGDV